MDFLLDALVMDALSVLLTEHLIPKRAARIHHCDRGCARAPLDPCKWHSLRPGWTSHFVDYTLAAVRFLTQHQFASVKRLCVSNLGVALHASQDHLESATTRSHVVKARGINVAWRGTALAYVRPLQGRKGPCVERLAAAEMDS